MKNKLAAFYRMYLNDFLTIERFAEWHGMSEEDAKTLVNMGRMFYSEEEEMKEF